ncbi:FtsX-like permease family protein [Paenibacillus mucilaginosus]|uniref:Putative ABC-type transport system,permease n=1 Tax=Paenibacillus mucilaginosus (strain KNP414) TaxID=1036673 RepID=F8F8I6_PAEMK|nr:FtsX-like permease family protein [Paenibacillus mucilaginosus]AEI41574.1 putative ABC-type transport system,permease [Paenibacillus mucilaginosus KNP414]MCG7215394.1 FtsX-like permease family protein [Paenibacillus mucilaginosus]WDM30571.1 FtsX-like permease family protein [Paenibacillus mucilaginosus]
MNSIKIAFKLLRNNLQIYEFYLIVLVVTVATYYNFAAIQYNETFEQIAERIQSASVASMTCGFVLLCTVVFFMWHANGFFFKRRQKETGIYMLAGISTSKIGRVFAFESILLGVLSLLLGLAAGILFSKLFFMFLGKAMYLDVDIAFSVSMKAIIQLVIVFGLIFIALGFKNYREVKKSQLIDMLNATKVKPTVPQSNYLKGLSGVFFILTGYVVATGFADWRWDLLLSSMATLILVSLGTYLFFGSFLTIVFSKLIQSKRMIYKSVRLVSISNIFFRLKANYRSLAMTAILAAATVTAFSVSLSFKQYAEDHKIIEVPYSLSYVSSDAMKNDQVKEGVTEAIQASGHQLAGWNEVRLAAVKVEYDGSKKIDSNNEAFAIRYSELVKTLEFLKVEDRESLLAELKPQDDEVSFILNARSLASPIRVKGDSIRLNGGTYTVKESRQVPVTGNALGFGSKNIYVLSDEQYNKMVTGTSETTLNGLRITDQEHSEQLVKNLTALVPGGKVNGFSTQYVQDYYTLNTFFFLGLIMSLVFVLATFSTIYFKILSDALMDQEQYEILKKVGMSKLEIQRSVYLQVGMAFLLPVVVGIIHSVAAMDMLEDIMNASFFLQIALGIGLFAVLMIVFYIGISKNYTKMVYGD